MSELISIITPAYKAEKLISRATRSVLAQSYDNWEMLIVSDDGQDYKSILDKCDIKDERLRFLSTGEVASGAANARNVAIDNIAGSYATILDADDEYTNERLAILLPLAKQTGASCDDQVWLDVDGKALRAGLLEFENEEFINVKSYFDKMHFTMRYMVVKELLDKKYHVDLIMSQDRVMDFNILDQVDKVMISHEQSYIYHLNKGSTTQGRLSDKDILDMYILIYGKLNQGEIEFNKKEVLQLAKNYYKRKVEVNSKYLKLKEQGVYKDFYEFLEAEPDVKC